MFEVRESLIHGRGVFASTPIAPGQQIAEVDYRHACEQEWDDPYVLWLDDEHPVYVRCDMRYINHSSEPNVAYLDNGTVMALREIVPGEELTHNYAGDAGGSVSW